MKIFCLVLSLLIILIADFNFTVNAARHRRFVGGNPTGIKQFPYIVSLRNVTNHQHFCAGSIINRQFVLTAAHCLENKSPKDFYIAAGTPFLDAYRNKYCPRRFSIHSHYDDTKFINDIALIHLKTPIVFTKYIQKISLSHSESEPPIGSTMAISGWGDLQFNGNTSPTLQYSNVTSISLKQCRTKIRKILEDHGITKRHICTFDGANLGFCAGDSGGPLVWNGKQVGIVSWAIHCAKGYPDVYVKVASYLNWVKYTKKKLKMKKYVYD